MSIVLAGQKYEIPGVVTVSYLDDPKIVPRATDGSKRSTWIRGIMAHTVHGTRGKLLPGGKPSNRDQIYARYQANTARTVSWDFTVDTDGSVAWSNDPIERFSWHGHTVNPYTIGFEMVQESDGTMYEATIDAACKVINFILKFDHPLIAIQPFTPWYQGKPISGRIVRAQSGENGRNLCGIYGHRNVYIYSKLKDAKGNLILDANGKSQEDKTKFESVRGFGDPNDHLFLALKEKYGYEGFDTEVRTVGVDSEDVRVFKQRQVQLGLSGKDVDGIPGPTFRRLLKNSGKPDGLWVTLP